MAGAGGPPRGGARAGATVWAGSPSRGGGGRSGGPTMGLSALAEGGVSGGCLLGFGEEHDRKKRTTGVDREEQRSSQAVTACKARGICVHTKVMYAYPDLIVGPTSLDT